MTSRQCVWQSARGPGRRTNLLDIGASSDVLPLVIVAGPTKSTDRKLDGVPTARLNDYVFRLFSAGSGFPA